MGVKLYVGETLRLLGHPVVGKSDGFDATEATEAVTHIVLLEGVGESLHEDRLAVARHALCYRTGLVL